jgi:hypothetical protein
MRRITCEWSIKGHHRTNSAMVMMPRSGPPISPLCWLGRVDADLVPDPKRLNPHRRVRHSRRPIVPRVPSLEASGRRPRCMCPRRDGRHPKPFTVPDLRSAQPELLFVTRQRTFRDAAHRTSGLPPVRTRVRMERETRPLGSSQGRLGGVPSRGPLSQVTHADLVRAPLLYGGGADAVAIGGGSRALLTSLVYSTHRPILRGSAHQHTHLEADWHRAQVPSRTRALEALHVPAQ